MPTHDIIVIGASAGGVEALIELVQDLPSDLPASILVVLHFPPHSVSLLPQILSRNGGLVALHPRSGQRLENGRIYVAPPDRHMLLRDGRIVLNYGPRENGFRPAVDPLFRSAARSYGPRTVGVILSGTLGDGTAGLRAIKAAGGTAIVQDPKEAIFDIMPLNAISNVPVDDILPLSGIADKIIELSHQPVSDVGDTMNMADEHEREEAIVQRDLDRYEEGKKPTDSTVVTCPECGGVLWELKDGELLNFRCHVGHVYSSESLLAEQGETLEGALWAAVRALVERAVLMRRMAHRLGHQGSARLEQRFLNQANEVEQQAKLIRQNLLDGHYSDPRFNDLPPDEPKTSKGRRAGASAD